MTICTSHSSSSTWACTGAASRAGTIWGTVLTSMALIGSAGERQFKVTPNIYESSFYSSNTDTGTQGGVALGPRTVEVRRLDALFAAGEIPPAARRRDQGLGLPPRPRPSLERRVCHSTETPIEGILPLLAALRTGGGSRRSLKVRE